MKFLFSLDYLRKIMSTAISTATAAAAAAIILITFIWKLVIKSLLYDGLDV
jgi:hypothetical protein